MIGVLLKKKMSRIRWSIFLIPKKGKEKEKTETGNNSSRYLTSNKGEKSAGAF